MIGLFSLRAQHADGMLVSALDDIAWTLNLRGTDVHCVPVFVSYLLIASDKVSLFVDEAKVMDHGAKTCSFAVLSKQKPS